jgi:hypothetical protein
LVSRANQTEKLKTIVQPCSGIYAFHLDEYPRYSSPEMSLVATQPEDRSASSNNGHHYNIYLSTNTGSGLDHKKLPGDVVHVKGSLFKEQKCFYTNLFVEGKSTNIKPQ